MSVADLLVELRTYFSIEEKIELVLNRTQSVLVHSERASWCILTLRVSTSVRM